MQFLTNCNRYASYMNNMAVSMLSFISWLLCKKNDSLWSGTEWYHILKCDPKYGKKNVHTDAMKERN